MNINLNKSQEKKFNQIIDKLKDKGTRLTDIRIAIIKIIIVSDHPTTADIIKKLESFFVNVNVMSVYNTLDLLLSEHVLFANTFNGKQICYEIVTQRSLHFKCDRCYSVIHVDDEELNNFPITEIKRLADKYEMSLDHFKIEAHGLCKKCINL